MQEETSTVVVEPDKTVMEKLGEWIPDEQKEIVTNSKNIKLPIFVGVNEKSKLEEILKVVNDDEIYEVAVLSGERYRGMLQEYLFDKMTEEERKEMYKKSLQTKTAMECHQLMLDLSDFGYESIDADCLKRFFQTCRRQQLSNKQVQELLDVMVLYQKLEVINPEEKEYKREYELLVTNEDKKKAYLRKIANIDTQIQYLQAQKGLVEDDLRSFEIEENPVEAHATVVDNGKSEEPQSSGE